MPYGGRAFRVFHLRSSRAAALVPALLLALARLLDVAPGHRCPHHDALPVGHADAAAHSAGHEEHGAPQPDGAAPADEPHDGPCTCVDSCPAGVGVPLLASADARPITPAPQAAAPRPLDTDPPPTRLFPYLLPYPTAPPSIG